MLSSRNTLGDDEARLSRYEMMIETISGINYIIDKNYTIVIYSKQKWDAFARSNDGEELTENSNVEGKLVFDNFAGQKVREYYKQIYDQMFEGKKDEVVIKARCDAPEALRDNVIYLTPVYRDPKKKDKVIGILHQSLILKVEVRSEPVELLKKQDIKPDGEFLEICSICKSVKYGNKDNIRWISPKEYENLGGSKESNLEHSICDDCSVMINEFL